MVYPEILNWNLSMIQSMSPLKILDTNPSNMFMHIKTPGFFSYLVSNCTISCWKSVCSILIYFDGFFCCGPIRSVVRQLLHSGLIAWKMSKYGAFSGPNAGKYGPEKTGLKPARKVFLWMVFHKFDDLLFAIEVDIKLSSFSFMLSAIFSWHKYLIVMR